MQCTASLFACCGNPMSGLMLVVIGLATAAGNGVVAWFLQELGRDNAAIRFAYMHTLGDVVVSFALGRGPM